MSQYPGTIDSYNVIGTKKIPLTQGQYALVDSEDFDFLSQWKWHAVWSGYTKSYYAGRQVNYGNPGNRKQKSIRMHRVIMKTPEGMETDHINHDTLDNRKSNLRLCSKDDNQHNAKIRVDNKSGYKGVHKHGNRWYAQINIKGIRNYLGSFKTPIEAFEVYLQASLQLRGEFVYE